MMRLQKRMFFFTWPYPLLQMLKAKSRNSAEATQAWYNNHFDVSYPECIKLSTGHFRE